MAKLSARGRTVVHAVTREYDAATLQRAHDRSFPAGDPFAGKALTIWERSTRRLMSDGSVLEKRDIRFQPDSMDRDGRRHSYGWKLMGKLKPEYTPDAWLEIYRKPRNDGSPSQWKIESDRQVGKVISRTRVMRAIRSGEYVGFCLACGAETTGVEPDASGYTCEACGKPEVQGAEEILLGMA